VIHMKYKKGKGGAEDFPEEESAIRLMEAPPMELGITGIVGQFIGARPKTGAGALIRTVLAGLPFGELLRLRELLGLPLDQLAEKLNISRATLHRRKHAGRLDEGESDRVVRYARLVGKAADVFGGVEAAREWLQFPQFGLGNIAPLDYARTEVGAREVENLLGRIDHGVYS